MISLSAIGVVFVFSIVFAVVAWKQQSEDRLREEAKLADVVRALRRHHIQPPAPVKAAEAVDAQMLKRMRPQNDQPPPKSDTAARRQRASRGQGPDPSKPSGAARRNVA